MRVAIAGKGGVGKTSITAGLARSCAAEGRGVLAIDADPDMNLASLLGFPHSEKITPLIEMKSLIRERMGTGPGAQAGFFRLNPKVDDIPDEYSAEVDGIKLLIMGGIPKGGGGCACAENAFLKEVLRHVFAERDEVVLVDMEAGIEHLGRGTAQYVETLIVVVEPSRTSLDTAMRIRSLATDVGLDNVKIVGNKVVNTADEELIRNGCGSAPILGMVPYTEHLLEVSRGNTVLDPGKIPELTRITDHIFEGVSANE